MFQTKVIRRVISLLMFEVLENHFHNKDRILNTLRLAKITLKIKTFGLMVGFCALDIN